MRIIRDKNQLLELFKEMNSGGLVSYDDAEQALVFRFGSNGGPSEDEILTIKFTFVEYSHLPLGFDSVSIDKYGIDEIKIASEDEARDVVPDCSSLPLNYKKDDYRCYRFYANGVPSPFYIYCLNLEGWIES